MSEPEERPYAGTEEPSAEEKSKEIETDRSTVEEEKQFPEQEKEEVKKPMKKKAEPKRKEGEFSIAGISKQLEKQTNFLVRLEKVLPPLRKLVNDLDVQSKTVKEINTSTKQLQKQILKIQGAIQKGNVRKK
jgi:uncharacterized protein (DUF3084 family)